jgi:hypothetical protein
MMGLVYWIQSNENIYYFARQRVNKEKRREEE